MYIITDKKKWKRVAGQNNYILKSNNGFSISFIPGKASVPNLLSFNCQTEDGETALCEHGTYYILNGDHTNEYEKLVDKGFDACYSYFNENKKTNKSDRSD